MRIKSLPLSLKILYRTPLPFGFTLNDLPIAFLNSSCCKLLPGSPLYFWPEGRLYLWRQISKARENIVRKRLHAGFVEDWWWSYLSPHSYGLRRFHGYGLRNAGR